MPNCSDIFARLANCRLLFVFISEFYLCQPTLPRPRPRPRRCWARFGAGVEHVAAEDDDGDGHKLTHCCADDAEVGSGGGGLLRW